MSRMKVHSKRPGAVRLNKVEKEKSRRGKTVAMGAFITLLIVVVGLFVYVQATH